MPIQFFSSGVGKVTLVTNNQFYHVTVKKGPIFDGSDRSASTVEVVYITYPAFRKFVDELTED
jgi:hypothetical protein